MTLTAIQSFQNKEMSRDLIERFLFLRLLTAL